MKLLIFLILFGFITSCGGESRIKPPSNLIPQQQFEVILTDYYLSEAISDQQVSEGKDEFKSNHMNLQLMLKKHNLTSEVFFSNLTWYQQQPEVFETMHTNVINELTKREAELNKK